MVTEPWCVVNGCLERRRKLICHIRSLGQRNPVEDCVNVREALEPVEIVIHRADVCPYGQKRIVTLAESVYIATSLSTCKVSGKFMLNLLLVPIAAFFESTMILTGSVVNILLVGAEYAAALSS